MIRAGYRKSQKDDLLTEYASTTDVGRDIYMQLVPGAESYGH
jgi:hypothetical protein